MDNNQGSDKGNFLSRGLMGVIFILAGAIVLLGQFDVLPVELNWWALFILMPAAGALGGAYQRYRMEGNLFDMGVFMPGLIGLFMVGLSVSLLVGVSWSFNWNLLWPIMLILIGGGMVFGRSRRG
jgi:hypothetical protein